MSVPNGSRRGVASSRRPRRLPVPGLGRSLRTSSRPLACPRPYPRGRPCRKDTRTAEKTSWMGASSLFAINEDPSRRQRGAGSRRPTQQPGRKHDRECKRDGRRNPGRSTQASRDHGARSRALHDRMRLLRSDWAAEHSVRRGPPSSILEVPQRLQRSPSPGSGPNRVDGTAHRFRDRDRR